MEKKKGRRGLSKGEFLGRYNDKVVSIISEDGEQSSGAGGDDISALRCVKF